MFSIRSLARAQKLFRRSSPPPFPSAARVFYPIRRHRTAGRSQVKWQPIMGTGRARSRDDLRREQAVLSITAISEEEEEKGAELLDHISGAFKRTRDPEGSSAGGWSPRGSTPPPPPRGRAAVRSARKQAARRDSGFSVSPQAGVSNALAADGGAQRHPDPGRGRRHPGHLQERAAPGVQGRRGGWGPLHSGPPAASAS